MFDTVVELRLPIALPHCSDAGGMGRNPGHCSEYSLTCLNVRSVVWLRVALISVLCLPFYVVAPIVYLTLVFDLVVSLFCLALWP